MMMWAHVVVNSIDTDDAEFLANSDATVALSPMEGPSNLVYSYDADDTFVNGIEEPTEDPNEDEGELLTMEKFENMLDDFDIDSEDTTARAIVDVVVYDPDGVSIFKVTTASDDGS